MNSRNEGVFQLETKRRNVDNYVGNDEVYSQAVDMLLSGEVVAFPTETVYGLGAIATNEKAVAKIFKAKGRPSDNPLIVHIGTKEAAGEYVDFISPKAQKCMDIFWPGPLTLILQAKPNIFAPNVTAGLHTVGLRIPDHPVALRLLQMVNQPIAAPSANRSGKPSPTNALHVEKDLAGLIPLIIDGGATGIGLESSVVDFTVDPPVILRPGGVTAAMLREQIGEVIEPDTLQVSEANTPKAPGMKYAHYAPNAPVYLIKSDLSVVMKAVKDIQSTGQKVALLAPEEFKNTTPDWFFSFGNSINLETSAQMLYAHLRACDETAADIVLVIAPSSAGVGAAIYNRLEKASNGTWWSS